MKIQLALDRLSVERAVALAREVAPLVDWIEVGTSLVKEFGMASVRAMREALPKQTILADMKTFDNVRYELQIAYDAGADLVTIMGVAPLVTLEAGMAYARERGKRVMVDLLNAPGSTIEQLRREPAFRNAILCVHVSKDEQELGSGGGFTAPWISERAAHSDDPQELAVAGGITREMLPMLMRMHVDVAIAGSAITAADDPTAAARAFREAMAAR